MGKGQGALGPDSPAGRPFSQYSTAGASMPATRQRGFYSEILDSDMDPSNAEQLLQSASCGPQTLDLQPRLASQKQPLLRASDFLPEGAGEEAMQAAVDRQARLAAGAHSATTPSRALEPKVLVPFHPGPGHTPRRIVIERQKRLFALQDLSQLLADMGIDSSVPDPESAMPLEYFDNTEYECRPIDEWLSMGEENDDGTLFLPALFLKPPAEGGQPAIWTDCNVQSYDEELMKFTVMYKDGQTGSVMKALVPRIQLCFKAEDPFIFRDRVVAAYAAREAAEAAVRQSLYVECMPTEELPPIEKERISRMLGLALNTERLKERQLNASSLISEVNVEYGRCMSSIIFQQRAEAYAKSLDEVRLTQSPAPSGDLMFAGFTLVEPPQKKPAPELAVVEIPAHECLDQKRGFAFHTLLSKPEIISCTQKIRTECNKVVGLSLFATSMTKSVSDEEYKAAQDAALTTTVSYLKEAWTSTLKSAVRNSLKEVGKGWFNLNETSTEVYAMSKLKRFLKMVNFLMQDSVIYMAEASLQAYCDFVLERSSFDVQVKSPAEVVVAAFGPSKNIAHLPPLFATEIVAKDGEGIGFRIAPEDFVDGVLAAFDKAAASVQDIPQLEKFVMEGVFWSDTPMLQTISTYEGVAPSCRATFKEALLKTLPPMEAYLELYKPYEDAVMLSVEEYMADYAKNEERSIQEMQSDVRKQNEMIANIERDIPLSVTIGIFAVSTGQVRKFLVERHQLLANSILGIIATKVKRRGESLVKSFQDIARSLGREVPDLEAVAELEEYVQNLPVEIEELQQGLQEMQSENGVLEDFEYGMSDAEFKTFWATISWPMKIDEAMGKSLERCVEKREEFALLQRSEQDAFDKSLNKLEDVVNKFGKHTDLAKVKEVSEQVLKLQGELKEADQKKLLFNKREAILGTPMTDYSQLGKIQKAFEPYANLWTTAANWVQWQTDWLEGPFINLDPETMERELGNAQRTMFKLVKQFDGVAGLGEISKTVKSEIEEFMPVMPLVTALRNPGMRERHWNELTKLTGKDLNQATSPEFTLTQLRTMGLDEQLEIVTKTCDVAGKEYAIEQAMDKMEGEWKGVNLDMSPYRETGTYVLKGFDVVQQLLDDHIVMTQSMSFSPFKGPFAQRIEDWERLLTLMSEIFEEWIKCQRQWMYLEPIFSSDDIMRQLPTEGKRFQGVDRVWRKMMGTANHDPDCITFCKTPRLLPSFTESNQMLEMVQKGLTDYLETKRAAFARFYFLSNDELLEILSQSKDPLAVQPHLSKCFENVNKLDFQKDLCMVAMYSGEGERVPFKSTHYPEGSVEFWLTDILCEMKATVQEQIVLSEADYRASPRGEWVLRWPGQVIIAGSTLFWTEEVEAAINANGNAGLHEYYNQSHAQLMELTRIVATKITKLQRKSIGALITIDVHARDVVRAMADSGVKDITDFQWISQLRYELCDKNHPQLEEQKQKGTSPGSSPEGITLVKQVDACFQYGNEYLGNSMRLVITPLTDRIYLTLTGALQLYMGGAPAGPAGTGKTETTKDLAKALAKQCVVFNCSDQLDYIAMAKFFKGMAMSGAWACFDEFNRIDLEVLSVVAQQVSSVQLAMQAGLKRFNFEGDEINLDDTNAAFITMNPGYAGRSELPDNLKALFRPVACMVPNYAMIAEIRLYSFGYTDARRLSQKMVKTFQLSSEQLSSQDHYDFGMRAVNTVIQAAGNNRAANPDMVEDLLVLSALADSNKPKFLAEDMILFNSILSDLFPGQNVPQPDYTDLNERISANCAKYNYIPTEAFLFKCIQIFEVSVLRHGFMTVGPAGGGKTTALHMLNAAMTDLDSDEGKYQRVNRYILNPKAITMGQLYGEFDENTHEWTDGVLCVLYRQAVAEYMQHQKTDRQWIVFDGPVDAIWIESMNTVLDDNKKLCLVSGEIISMTPYMNMMFEVEDLAVASPATVSRVGTIFMEPEKVVGTEVQIKTWILSLHDVVKPYGEKMTEMLNKLVPEMNEFSRKRTKEYCPSVENCLTASVLNILHTFWTQFIPIDGVYELPDGLIEKLPKLIEKFVAFSVIWGACATSDNPSRAKLDLQFRELLKTTGYEDSVGLPQEGLIFDFAVDVWTNSWVGWMTTVPEFKLKPTTPFADIIVPTLDSVRYMNVLEKLVLHEFHVLCVGPTGTGKTLAVLDKLMSGMPDKYTPVKVGFSAQTSANQTQDLLDAKLDKRRKGIYGPPAGKKYTVFVDDVNMPQREVYGAQPPIEILRFWLGHDGWYDRKTQEWHKIIDMSFVGAMGPPGGGRQIVTNRFLRYFSFISFPELENSSMTQIFDVILRTFVDAYLSPDIVPCVEPMIEATLDLYATLLKELLPTPAKSHYTFNLRDIASVMQGVCSVNPKSCEEPADLIRLWVHENLRVFRDRLINEDDRAWFDNQLRVLIPKYFKGEAFAKADINGNGCLEWEEVVFCEIPHLIYGDFMDPNADPKLYSEITDIDKMVTTVEEYLEDYNAMSTKKMPLVMFVDAVGHVARVSRVIRQPMGNALLLGVGGSGRQSLSRLAASMSDFECFQIEITKTYGKVEWKDDLKKLLLKTGQEGKPMVFLFTDTQIVKESFLEDINNILNTGEVPNLLDDNDVGSIVNDMRPIAQANGTPQTKVAMFAIYISRVRANLHFSLCMSPLGEAFRTRLRNFPSLVNNCTIDYFAPWPEEALRSVAKNTLDTIDMGSDDVKEGIVQMCGRIHQSVEVASVRYLDEQRRYNYVTPTSYLEVLSTFKTLLAIKRDQVGTAKKRLVIGLDKLDSTEVEVAALRKQIEEMQPVLIKTSKEVEVMMEQIAADKIEAGKTQEVVEKEEKIASVKAAECAEIKESAERDLAEALPALDAAIAVLKNLKLSDLSEAAKYSNPPGGVKLTMEAMCVLKNVPPKMEGAAGQKVANYWEPGKKMLTAGKELLDSMFNFDKDNIPEKIIQKLQPYIENEDFTPKKIESASKACTAMCQWVHAMNKYHFVAKEVEPKRKALAEAMEQLEELNANLAKLQAQLKEVQDKIAMLEDKFNKAVAQKEELAAKVEDATIKNDRAGRLLGGLGGEKIRWKETVERLTIEEGNLIGDVCLSSGYVAYLGPFVAAYRDEMCADWRSQLVSLNVPHTEGSSLIKVMADPVKLRQWQVDGLPADGLSTENGIILANAFRWPLCIDPQGQANKWIRNMEQEAGVEIGKPSDKEFLRSIENAVRFGKPFIMENVLENLDPALEPVLLKKTFKQGGNIVMKIGDNTIPYHPDFKFYLTTKLPNPHYAPETAVKVTLLNFTITQEGLEDQLLGITVAKERADLQELKDQLVISNAKMAAQLKDIESTILRLLSESSGNILDDEGLINTLAQSKVTSNEIEVKAKEAAETEKMIDSTREEYRPVAFHAALLFFCVADMGTVNDMYQYSMPWFVNLYVKSIEDSEKSDDIPTRLKTLADWFTYSLYENICRSLFAAHKLLFSFTVCIKIMQGQGRIDAEEWRFFLSASSGGVENVKNPAPEWLTSQVWTPLCSLSRLPAFIGIAASIAGDIQQWRAYFDSADPHSEPIPGKWGNKLNRFQALCVLRCVRPDKVVPGMQDFVTANIGGRFIEAPPLHLPTCFKDSSNVYPLVFVLSAGADPGEMLNAFAKEMKFDKKLSAISLGQGQGPIAEKMMNLAVERGSWVLLQNCHLAGSWMPKLEAIVEQWDPDAMHRDFRLWLTSMPSNRFPVSILQNSIKMTSEPPRGVKANLNVAYLGFSDEYFEKQPKPHPFKKILFGISFFHALLQDRRKFGALGFNIRYEFTNSDLKCSILQLENFLSKYDHVPYAVLVNLVGHINYGGRITDDWDRRMVLCVLMSIVNPGILEDDYPLAPGEHYLSPVANDIASYRERISTLPINPHPNVFGLHENADIACAQAETQELCDIMLSLQPKVSTGGGKSKEDIVGETAVALMERNFKTFDLDEISTMYPLLYTESMNTVLVQEAMRYNKLIKIYNSSLNDLKKALKGLVVMSADLEDMSTALFSNAVPAIWAKKAFPSLKPLAAWVDDLQERLEFVIKWVEKGTPAAYWVSGFFFPQAFLTGTLQNYARKYQVAIDTVDFAFHVLQKQGDDITAKPEDGVYIYGLFLEGAAWDAAEHCLVESKPKELFVTFPAIHLDPVVNRQVPTEGVYSCPCYKTTVRAGTLSTTGHSTNFVLMVEVPSKEPCSGNFHKYVETFSAHWIKRAVALFTTLAY